MDERSQEIAAESKAITSAIEAAKRTYVVVVRCTSSAIFEEHKELLIASPERDDLPTECRYTTRYEDQGFEVRVPGALRIVARGRSSADLTQVAQTFANRAGEITSILSLAANAQIGPLQVELAYDDTPEAEEHEYLQVYIRDAPAELISSRTIPMAESRRLIAAISSSTNARRIVRGTVQYAAALRQWEYGNEIIALNHLYMGIEALKPAALAHHLATRGLAEDQLAREWGFSKGAGHMNQQEYLLAEARRRLLFEGDDKCHQIAKKVSDNFEHGFVNYGELRPGAAQVVVQTARHVRAGLFRLSNVDDDTRNTLLASPYSTPIGQLRAVKYLRGRLIGKGPLAGQDQEHPFCDWETKLGRVYLTDKGLYAMQPSEKLTARINDSVKLQPTALEVWNGAQLVEQPLPEVKKP